MHPDFKKKKEPKTVEVRKSFTSIFTLTTAVLFCLQFVPITASLVTTVLILRSSLVASEYSQGGSDYAPT